MKQKCEIYRDPDWPEPAALAGLLDDPALARQWRQLATA
jgi:hypothetical protein